MIKEIGKGTRQWEGCGGVCVCGGGGGGGGLSLVFGLRLPGT